MRVPLGTRCPHSSKSCQAEREGEGVMSSGWAVEGAAQLAVEGAATNREHSSEQLPLRLSPAAAISSPLSSAQQLLWLACSATRGNPAMMGVTRIASLICGADASNKNGRGWLVGNAGSRLAQLRSA